MSKPNLKSFLKEFFLINAILFVIYLALTTVVGMFFGGAVLEFGEAFASGEKQSIFLTVFYALLQSAAFIGFYAFSLFRFQSKTEEKRAFLAEIETEKFNPSEFSPKYFSEKGKRLLIYFSSTYGLISFARFIGIPVPLFLIFPQSMLLNVLHLVIGKKAGFMGIALFIISITVNIASYFIYQRFICVKVYEKWANERMRVN